MARYSTLIFDFDGTVAYTAADVWDAVEAGTLVFGKKVDPDYRADPRNPSLHPRKIFEDCLGPLTDDDYMRAQKALGQYYGQDTDYPKTVLYPGMDEFLDRTRSEGISAGIVTRKSARSLGRILEIKGWTHWLSGWYGSESLGGKKTKAELIEALLKEMPDSSRPVYIGDSAGDITAAKELGIPSIAVTYGDGDTETLLAAGPDKVCYTVPDLYMWIFNKEQ